MKTIEHNFFGYKCIAPNSDFITQNEFSTLRLCAMASLLQNKTSEIAHELKPCDFKVSKQTYENRFLPVNSKVFSYTSYEKEPKN